MELLLLTSELHPDPVLPSLSLLPHTIRTAPPEPSSLLEAGTADAVLVDARTDLSSARGLCRLLSTAGRSVPVLTTGDLNTGRCPRIYRRSGGQEESLFFFGFLVS